MKRCSEQGPVESFIGLEIVERRARRRLCRANEKRSARKRSSAPFLMMARSKISISRWCRTRSGGTCYGPVGGAPLHLGAGHVCAGKFQFGDRGQAHGAPSRNETQASRARSRVFGIATAAACAIRTCTSPKFAYPDRWSAAGGASACRYGEGARADACGEGLGRA